MPVWDGVSRRNVGGFGGRVSSSRVYRSSPWHCRSVSYCRSKYEGVFKEGLTAYAKKARFYVKSIESFWTLTLTTEPPYCRFHTLSVLCFQKSVLPYATSWITDRFLHNIARYLLFCMELYLLILPCLLAHLVFLPTTYHRIHAAHVTIIAISAIDGPRAGELYDALRATYNQTRLPGAAAIPPREEWQGISQCCESVYCRYSLKQQVLLCRGEMQDIS